jgi:hypothetical protein
MFSAKLAIITSYISPTGRGFTQLIAVVAAGLPETVLCTWFVIVQGYLISFDGADRVEDLGSVSTEARFPHLHPPAPLLINVEYQRSESALTHTFDCLFMSISWKSSSKRWYKGPCLL